MIQNLSRRPAGGSLFPFQQLDHLPRKALFIQRPVHGDFLRLVYQPDNFRLMVLVAKNDGFPILHQQQHAVIGFHGGQRFENLFHQFLPLLCVPQDDPVAPPHHRPPLGGFLLLKSQDGNLMLVFALVLKGGRPGSVRKSVLAAGGKYDLDVCAGNIGRHAGQTFFVRFGGRRVAAVMPGGCAASGQQQAGREGENPDGGPREPAALLESRSHLALRHFVTAACASTTSGSRCNAS